MFHSVKLNTRPLAVQGHAGSGMLHGTETTGYNSRNYQQHLIIFHSYHTYIINDSISHNKIKKSIPSCSCKAQAFSWQTASSLAELEMLIAYRNLIPSKRKTSAFNSHETDSLMIIFFPALLFEWFPWWDGRWHWTSSSLLFNTIHIHRHVW